MDSPLLDDVTSVSLTGLESSELGEVLEESSSETEASPGRDEEAGGAERVADAGDLVASGLYATAMREVPLLAREEEVELGEAIREGRLRMTLALAGVPLAIGRFLATLEQVKSGARPATDALFAPFDIVDAEAADRTGGGRSRTGWTRAAQTLERRYRDWTAHSRDTRHAGRADGEYRRIRELFIRMEPSAVVLGEALDACRALDARVRRIERATGTFHADLLGAGERSSRERRSRGASIDARAELDAIATEAGTDLTTLRDACEASSAARQRMRSAQRRMVEANLRLAHFMAHKLKGHGVDFEDLVQDAMIGLMRAADKFDHRLGYKFSTYACQWIWQSITRSLADGSRTVRVAAHMHDTVIALRKVSRELQQRLGRDPSTAELAEASGVAEDKIRRALHAARNPLSLDAPLAELDDATLHACIADPAGDAPTTLAHDSRLAERVDAVLAGLPPREAFIVRMRHGIGAADAHTLEEIGKLLGITRERTRQIETRAMSRLRDALDPAMMEGLGE